MKILLKNPIILSPGSPLHQQQQNIFIENGTIAPIDMDAPQDADQTIEADGLCVSPGWVDGFAHFCDPGEEYKETLESGARAAAAGGYTEVMLIPNTTPPVSSKTQVEYLVQKGNHLPVVIHPIGAITKHIAGDELSEMYDMHQVGAIAFSDGLAPVQSSGLLQKALEYVKAIERTIIQLPDDNGIGATGLMNEGTVSTRIGMAGKPALSEELMIARDIEILRYTGSKLHITGVSTRKSVALIAAAKKEGLQISCSVTPYHLYFSDEDLQQYDTCLKVNPPLRTPADRQALIEAVQDGTIDFIASHHQPQDYDHKVCEFEKAAYGMETLESVFGAAGVCGISAETFVKMQSQNIRKIFGLHVPAIAAGQRANLTLFQPDVSSIFEMKDIRSKCRNNAFVGKELKGAVLGIINGNQIYLY